MHLTYWLLRGAIPLGLGLLFVLLLLLNGLAYWRAQGKDDQ